MLELRVKTAIEFRNMLETISSISDTVHIKLSDKKTHFSALLSRTRIVAVLHLPPQFYFHHHIPRYITLRLLEFSKVISFLSCFGDDLGEVYILSNDDFPITYLDFHVNNSKNDETQKLTVKVTEFDGKPIGDEAPHEFKVTIRPDFIKDIAKHSEENETPIHIIVTSKFYILNSGTMRSLQYISNSKEVEGEIEIKDAPKSMYYELQLPWKGLAKSIFLASSIAEGIFLRDSCCSSRPTTILEFNFSSSLSCKLVFHIHGCCVPYIIETYLTRK